MKSLKRIARRVLRPRRVVQHVMTPELWRLNREAAESVGVSPEVHGLDHIYWYCIDETPTLEQGTSAYFLDGKTSADRFDSITADLGPCSVLEFAAGFGRVTRHLQKNPRLSLTACDIHTEALDFFTRILNVPAIPSTERPEDFTTPQTYDVVFALSFFTHLPRRTFGPWLRALFSAVSPGGLLVFTTHGYKCRRELPPLTDGYWFEPSSEQPDLETASYGTSITSPDFVVGEIYRQLKAPIVSFTQAGWWSSQDVWVVNRS